MIVSFVEVLLYSVLNKFGIQKRKGIYHHLNKVYFVEWMHKQNEAQASELVRCQRKQEKYPLLSQECCCMLNNIPVAINEKVK